MVNINHQIEFASPFRWQLINPNFFDVLISDSTNTEMPVSAVWNYIFISYKTNKMTVICITQVIWDQSTLSAMSGHSRRLNLLICYCAEQAHECYLEKIHQQRIEEKAVTVLNTLNWLTSNIWDLKCRNTTMSNESLVLKTDLKQVRMKIPCITTLMNRVLSVIAHLFHFGSVWIVTVLGFLKMH